MQAGTSRRSAACELTPHGALLLAQVDLWREQIVTAHAAGHLDSGRHRVPARSVPVDPPPAHPPANSERARQQADAHDQLHEPHGFSAHL